MLAHYQYQYSIDIASHFSEPNDEPLEFEITKSPPGATNDFLQLQLNSTHIFFDNMTSNDLVGNYTVTVSVGDGHAHPSLPNFTFDVCILYNNPPTLQTTPTQPSSVTVGKLWSYSFLKSWAIDPDGNPIT